MIEEPCRCCREPTRHSRVNGDGESLNLQGQLRQKETSTGKMKRRCRYRFHKRVQGQKERDHTVRIHETEVNK